MAYHFLINLLCCGRYNQEDDFDIPAHQEDENTRLIPDEMDPYMYSDPALMNRHRMQQKLDTIVKAKERKMVNVGSQIPFNLHNKTLPPEVNHSLSRSSSGYLDYFDSSEDYGARPSNRRQPYPHDPYSRFTTSASTSPGPSRSRSHSRTRSIEREPPTPILNVRLVGYVDRRGRTMRRNQPDVVVDAAASESTPTQSKVQHLPDPSFKLHEAGAISLSWGD